MRLVKVLLNRLLFLLWPKYMKGGNEHDEFLVLRHWFLQKVLRVNSNVPWPVHFTSRVLSPQNIDRGTRTPGLGVCCHIDGRNGIRLGKNVWIGPRVSIISMNHDLSDYHKYTRQDPVVIGDNCWLATNSIILPGVELGDHTIVAAGAVVTKSFLEGNVIIGGTPARVIKHLARYREER